MDEISASKFKGIVTLSGLDGFRLVELHPGLKPKPFHYKGKDYYATWRNPYANVVFLYHWRDNRLLTHIVDIH